MVNDDAIATSHCAFTHNHLAQNALHTWLIRRSNVYPPKQVRITSSKVSRMKSRRIKTLASPTFPCSPTVPLWIHQTPLHPMSGSATSSLCALRNRSNRYGVGFLSLAKTDPRIRKPEQGDSIGGIQTWKQEGEPNYACT